MKIEILVDRKAWGDCTVSESKVEEFLGRLEELLDEYEEDED